MNKFLQIALYEFKRHVFRKRFIFSLLSIPLVLFFMGGMILLIIKFENNESPIGIIDFSNSINTSLEIPETADLALPVEIISFENEETALTALESEQIQAYFIIPEGYPGNTSVSVYYIEEPGENAYDHFRNLMQLNLLQGKSENVVNRILDGYSSTIRTPDGLREFSERNALNLALPAIASFLFMFIIMISGNYFSVIIAEEKENRTMEILATTVSPTQLIGGKIFGTTGIVFTQLFSWITIIIIAQQIAASQIDAVWLKHPIIKFETILLILSIFIPAFIFYASLITMVGATATNVQEGQQIAGIFIMPLSFSFMLLPVIMENPNSPLSLAVSIFPFTAPILMPIRAAFSNVPLGQIILSVSILLISSASAIWLAARAFEIGMLRYGKKIQFRELFKKSSRLNS